MAKFDAYQMVTDRICAMLEKGVCPWDRPWVGASTTAWSGNNGRPYSFLNQMLLADPSAKYETIEDMLEDIKGEWVTFEEAKRRGGFVRQGEKGRKIVWFSMVESKKELDEDGNPKRFPTLTWHTVFHVRQCEGVEQRFHQDGDMLFDFNPNQTADEVASGYLFRENVGFRTMKCDQAFYRLSEDLIVLPLPEQFREDEEYYSTLFHEITHSTGHPKRLNRITSDAAHGNSYSLEELVAEIGSASIMATLGVETKSTFKNSAAYIQNWLAALRNDKRMVVKAATQAEKAIKLILDIQEDAA